MFLFSSPGPGVTVWRGGDPQRPRSSREGHQGQEPTKRKVLLAMSKGFLFSSIHECIQLFQQQKEIVIHKLMQKYLTVHVQ